MVTRSSCDVPKLNAFIHKAYIEAGIRKNSALSNVVDLKDTLFIIKN